MDHNRHMRIRSRQATALVAALSLILHVGLMALSARPQSSPSIDREASVHHGHRPGDADGSRPEGHGRTGAHGKPCCILSYLGGMPAPPFDGWRIRVRPVVSFPGYESLASVGAAPFNKLYPVGARAPPSAA